MSYKELTDDFWKSFGIAYAGEFYIPGEYEAWGFGDSPAMANELGELVRSGVKTATCSLQWAYEAGQEALPEEGALSMIVDGQGRPLCVIQTTEVTVRPFYGIDDEFAAAEGEGDRTLVYWRAAHWAFFTRVCSEIGRFPADDMPLVCERFRVLYPLNRD